MYRTGLHIVEGPIDRGRLGPADVLVPAATSYAVHDANPDRVVAPYIVEAANLPVTASAEEKLRRRGCVIVPDVVADSGTNAW